MFAVPRLARSTLAAPLPTRSTPGRRLRQR
jgi:hypothetical protein